MLVVCLAWFIRCRRSWFSHCNLPIPAGGWLHFTRILSFGRSCWLLTLARLAGVLCWASLAITACSPLFILLSLVGPIAFRSSFLALLALTVAPLPPLPAPFPSVAHTHLGLNQWLPNQPLGRGSVTGWARSVVHGGSPVGGVGGGLVLVWLLSAVWCGSFSVCFLCPRQLVLGLRSSVIF